jgi:hypothetical protein
MAWARVDDGWWSHPKVMDLSLAARGLWVSALSWSCHQRKDVVPVRFLAIVGAAPSDADELSEAGLWLPVDGGWRIHDWADYQVMTVSEKRAESGRKGGKSSGLSRRSGSKSKQTVEANVKQTEFASQPNGEAGPSLPIPSLPDYGLSHMFVTPQGVS